MYINEIQYTYKLCKLLLMESIHENKGCIHDISKLKTVFMINQNSKLDSMSFCVSVYHVYGFEFRTIIYTSFSFMNKFYQKKFTLVYTCIGFHPVSYTHLTLPTIYSV